MSELPNDNLFMLLGWLRARGQDAPGPVEQDRIRLIRMRMAMGDYPAVADLVAEAIMLASCSGAGDSWLPGADIAGEVQQIMAAMLRTGSPHDLMQLQLEFVEDLSLPAIALLLGIAADDAARLRSRALARLAAALAG